MATKFKVLTGSAELGGSLARQRDIVQAAGADLEAKLNAGGVTKVVAGGAYESAHDIVLFAVVEFEEKESSKKAKGKGE